MVRLLGCEVGHRVVAEPRQGVGDADQGQPPLPGGAELPHRRRAPLQRLVRRLHRRQQERHARGREALPTSVRGRLRRLACDPPVHEPERAAGAAVDAAVQTDRRGSFAFARLAGQRVLRAGPEGGRNGQRLRARNPVLASVLFLVGISTQFSSRRLRYGLLATGALLLLLAAEQILSLPGPP